MASPKDSGGKKPTQPVIGTPNRLNNVTSDSNSQQVQVTFTHAYTGKGTVTYTATSSPGGRTGTSSSSPVTVSGLTSNTAYTFTVSATTNYGVTADVSAASPSVTPPYFPPSFCPPCAPQPWPGNCTYIGITCDGQVSYQYYDCGGCQTCAGTGGYNGAYRDGQCGYVAPPSFGPSFPPPFGPSFGPSFGPAFK